MVRTCKNGSLKYHKFQNIEKTSKITQMIDCQRTRRADCEQSNRGDRRRNEKRTSSSHERETLYNDQQEKQTDGKDGDTQGLSLIDGDVPLCIRSREAIINESKKMKGSSKEATEGSGSKERTRREAKSEIEVNDTISSSTKREKFAT